MKTANRIIEGFTLVSLGLIFLGSTLGYLPWSVGATFFALLSLWPVLLVSAGLDIIGRGLDTQWLRLLSSLVVLAAVLFGGLVLPASDVQSRWFPFYWPWSASESSNPNESSSKPFEFSEPRGGVTRAVATVNGGAGDIEVRAGDRNTLVAIAGRSPFNNPFLTVSKTSRTAADVEASMGEGPTFFPFMGTSEMDVSISPAVRWDLTLETGAATLNADLAPISLSSFALKTGASDSEIKLGGLSPKAGEVPVTVKAGAASVVIKVPQDVAVRVESRSGLSSVNVPETFSRDDSSDERVYTTGNWQSASARYAVLVEMGIGSFSIEQY